MSTSEWKSENMLHWETDFAFDYNESKTLWIPLKLIKIDSTGGDLLKILTTDVKKEEKKN